jgi:hypothetical protein
MKRCVKCSRVYDNDLNFCLDDGTPLRPDQDNSTWVMPPPVPPAPPTARPGAKPKSSAWKVFSAVGIALAIVIYALLKIAVWSHDQEINSPAPNTKESPALVKIAPIPSPTASPRPSPSDSSIVIPSASPTVTPVEPALSPGTYQGEFQASGKPEDESGLRRIKMQFVFNADGTYTAQGFITIEILGVNDRLYHEERGTYSASSNRITFRERMERQLDVETNSWSPWKVPDSGAVGAQTIRNITPDYFQMYTSSGWVRFSKL